MAEGLPSTTLLTAKPSRALKCETEIWASFLEEILWFEAFALKQFFETACGMKGYLNV